MWQLAPAEPRPRVWERAPPARTARGCCRSSRHNRNSRRTSPPGTIAPSGPAGNAHRALPAAVSTGAVAGRSIPSSEGAIMASSLSIDVFNSGYKPIPGGPGWDDSTPATWPARTSTPISGDRDAVLVDALLTTSEGERLAAWVRNAGKRPQAIFVTHGHGDHFSGGWAGTGRLPRRSAGGLRSAGRRPVAPLHRGLRPGTGKVRHAT